MISKWNYLPLTEKEKQAKEILSRTLGLDPYICELLVLRGVTNETDAKKFFRPQLSVFTERHGQSCKSSE